MVSIDSSDAKYAVESVFPTALNLGEWRQDLSLQVRGLWLNVQGFRTAAGLSAGESRR